MKGTRVPHNGSIDIEESIESVARKIGDWFTMPEISTRLRNNQVPWVCRKMARGGVLEVRVNPKYANTGRYHQAADYLQYRLKEGYERDE